jgi:hypothetical protein
MAHAASGKTKSQTSEKNFFVDLGTSTSIKISLHGKMQGILAGQPISGYGDLEYTYAQGASEWVRTDIGGSASGPATLPITLAPSHSIVYDPTGRCNAKVSIETTGTAEVETPGFKYKHKKDAWKMKGRTDTLTISVTQNVAGPVCDPDAVLAAAGYGSGAWTNDQCNAYANINGSGISHAEAAIGSPTFGFGQTPGSECASTMGMYADMVYPEKCA